MYADGQSELRAIIWDFDKDPSGRPLALVIYDDETHQRFYHEELGR